MTTVLQANQIFKRQIALPTDHGSWVFLFSPLLIGLFAGARWTPVTGWLVLAAITAFLIRQPVTYLVKIYSRRRSEKELPYAWFWTGVYALVGLVALVGLIMAGYSYLLLLALSGLPVFAWHLYLVSKRSERRQMGVEIVGAGVLALAAPAAYWAARGEIDPQGWLLWTLSWLQSAASIVYAYLRLEQRVLKSNPETRTQIAMAWRALGYTGFNLSLVAALGLAGLVTPWLVTPYLLQLGETIYGTLKPAFGVKPVAIGVRQLIVSTLFTLLFILAWQMG